jgi:hypothetical protein
MSDAETGKPLSKIQVEVSNQGRFSVIETDNEGRYTVDNLRLGGLGLKVKCPPKSPTKSVLADVFPVTPGMDSTVNIPVVFAECASQ